MNCYWFCELLNKNLYIILFIIVKNYMIFSKVHFKTMAENSFSLFFKTKFEPSNPITLPGVLASRYPICQTFSVLTVPST